ncbi:EAL domain-containing response regulator [Pseudomonas matsuisoli]|uniref:Protein FimX n=1 Tax=Pseudomonas matsuisoli TaxID=1515666 RepID=A0A917PXM3_9PSED|nr:EAL domain-containing protein [Pseudomonas matsuisoli]GGJ97512.1 protein FimX [Pseudomonas matsuisoli]
MATEKSTIRLLILEDSQNEAERLASLFRNNGRATRLYRLTSEEDLIDVLRQDWDLLIAAPESELLAPADALTHIRRLGKDVPFIQLVADNDSDSITEALLQGAHNALPQHEDERLLLVATREIAALQDRRARREAEHALSEAEKRCELLLDSSVDAITYVHDGMHIYANRTYLGLFGYDDAEEVEGVPMMDLITCKDQNTLKDYLKHYGDSNAAPELHCQGIRADGERFPARMSLSPASYDGEPCIQVVIRAETENAELEEKIREISSQDPVTGLFNRQHFLELVAGALQAEQPICVAYLRIDQYSTVLADIGITGTDILLVELTQILSEHIADGAQLARFGDDAFAALMPSEVSGKKTSLEALLHKVEGHLFEINGRTVQITLTIGLTGTDEQTLQAQDVIDRALRCVDESNAGNRLKTYDASEALAAAASRGDVLAMIQHALANSAFRLLFQPVISLRGDTAEHYEVLLRLLTLEGEEIPPERFLEAAKETGMATRIDRWVILNAVQLLAEHRSRGNNTRLFIHLSSASLQDPSLVTWLAGLIKAHGLAPDTLIFQLLEADAITYLKQARELSKGLAALNCHLSLTHFGQSQNPFNTLKHLDVTFVKIDTSLVQDLGDTMRRDALNEMLANIHSRAKLSIVPTVETAAMLASLWQAGVNYIQGFYLQEPTQSMNYDFSSDEG